MKLSKRCLLAILLRHNFSQPIHRLGLANRVTSNEKQSYDELTMKRMFPTQLHQCYERWYLNRKSFTLRRQDLRLPCVDFGMLWQEEFFYQGMGLTVLGALWTLVFGRVSPLDRNDCLLDRDNASLHTTSSASPLHSIRPVTTLNKRRLTSRMSAPTATLYRDDAG